MSRRMSDCVHQLAVDHSEHHSALLDEVRRSGWFDVRMDRLATGDYLLNGEVLVERKTIRDLVASLIDGRLFPQVARLAHSPYRSLLLIEGSTPSSLPDVHHHSVEGALVSIAAIWRVPVLHSADSEQSARMLRLVADQVRGPRARVLRRFDRKPKRLASRRLFLLQGLPGVGPALAHRLLCHFGSIERILTVDAAALAEVRGIGARKAARIRELVGNPSLFGSATAQTLCVRNDSASDQLKLLRERVDALQRAGAVAWSGRRLQPAKPAGKVGGYKTVADLVVENRE
jgi:ERCC4-type nuclease